MSHIYIWFILPFISVTWYNSSHHSKHSDVASRWPLMECTYKYIYCMYLNAKFEALVLNFSISTLWSRMNLTVKCPQFVVSDPTWVQLPPQVPRPADTTDDEKPPPLPQPRKKAPKTARVWHQVSAGAETTPSTHLCRVFTGSPHSLHFFLQVHVSYGASLLMFYWGRRLHD